MRKEPVSVASLLKTAPALPAPERVVRETVLVLGHARDAVAAKREPASPNESALRTPCLQARGNSGEHEGPWKAPVVTGHAAMAGLVTLPFGSRYRRAGRSGSTRMRMPTAFMIAMKLFSSGLPFAQSVR